MVKFRLIQRILLAILILIFRLGFSQNYAKYNVNNGFAHNDYLNQYPLTQSFELGFGLIEVDVFCVNHELLVSHDSKELTKGRTFKALYLQPLAKYWKSGKQRPLSILVDLKTDWQYTLPLVIEQIKEFPELQKDIKWIISGSRPDKTLYSNYPDYIYFDARPRDTFNSKQLKKVGLISDDFANYTQWSGKGKPTVEEESVIFRLVKKAHELGISFRFWNTPDTINAWITLIKYGVDYIGTDNPYELYKVLSQMPNQYYVSEVSYRAYQPKLNGFKPRAKNIILFIADGVSLPQLYAAYTANGGYLNIFNMPNSGISSTYSADAYITDSAPGATAFSSGVKTRNTYVGVDENKQQLKLLPSILHDKGIKTAIITTGDITDATPADFYAHVADRSNSSLILSQFASSKVKFLIGGNTSGFNSNIMKSLEHHNIKVLDSYRNWQPQLNQRSIIMDSLASKMYLEGRGEWLSQVFNKTLTELKQNPNGFFLIVEASRTDIGGHWNNLKFVVSELQDMDNVVGEALKFADDNKETLVIVIGDHETGGFTLLGGDFEKKLIMGNFITNDHTALPAICFAYGPKSTQFNGFFQNTDIFYKILNAIKN